MTSDADWAEYLAQDVRFGFHDLHTFAPKRHNPEVVLNDKSGSVLRTLREELKRSDSFLFSVAFVSPRAIALLKQEFVDYPGSGHVITSDYLGFNSPRAFAELLNLQRIGLDVRIHSAKAFHPKGYIFEDQHTVTAMMGSSNLTEYALVQNHEWNLKVSAARGSDLAAQVSALIHEQLVGSVELTQEWIDEYSENYVVPNRRPPRRAATLLPAVTAQTDATKDDQVVPNKMQRAALFEIDRVRQMGQHRAIVISATGTGKTILSALDVRAFHPRRMLFVVHREQILDRTIQEYQRVLGGPSSDYGKLTGSVKQPNRRFLFATVQTLSKAGVLDTFSPDEFDYVIIDEAHRAGAGSHRQVIDYFRPQFLLGMTATPERTDGFNVFELFDYNVPFEIRLNRALEEDMLSPFHYYGVADVTYENGITTTDETELRLLISPARVQHVINALETYGQAGVAPRGLIFCSRTDEAHVLSAELNSRTLRGRPLRTIALTGEDSIEYREAKVAALERGELDYILTVDILNEGVDIPTVNQVVMLRQTQSAIVFVQQLGRGLRKAKGKEYLVVIDFIGNYANNYLIPIALFGDDSLNKESLRKKLIAAEEVGVLPGLSSVRFDKISQERVLRSITDTALDSMQRLKAALTAMRNRVGGVPQLWDFLRFESVDPVVLATKKANYPALVQSLLGVDSGLSPYESRALGFLSHEVLPAKRLHEIVALEHLINSGTTSGDELLEVFARNGLPATETLLRSAIDTFTLVGHPMGIVKHYDSIVKTDGLDSIALTSDFRASYTSSRHFAAAVSDVVKTGRELIRERYAQDIPFTPGRQYSREDATRLLGWPRKWASTIYGYKVHEETASCPIFVTLHKSVGVSASTAYEDELLDPSTLLWYTRSRRTLQSAEVRAIVEHRVALHVFVKKDDAEGSDFYCLGRATAQMSEQVTMPDDAGNPLNVVRMRLHFNEPIDIALYDYFHPLVTL